MDEITKLNLIQKYLEYGLSQIKKTSIKNFVIKTLLQKVPEYFWFISSSKKHHNKDERGEQGLLLHTFRVTKILTQLIDALSVDIKDQDCLYAAAILHDACRCGFSGREKKNKETEELWTDYLHPYYVRALFSKKYGKNGFFDKIMTIIEGHMGKYSHIPKTYDAKEIHDPVFVLHMADYVASRDLKIWFKLGEE